MMRHLVLAVVMLASGVMAALAQDDPIAARKALMKQNSAQSKVAREMIQGKEPFDLAKAQKVLTVLASVAEKGKNLWPESSKAGDTNALPAIWENKADFEARLLKLSADAKAAEPRVKDLETFKAEMTVVGKNCGDCHNTYRKKP